jgi:hypothetical protein
VPDHPNIAVPQIEVELANHRIAQLRDTLSLHGNEGVHPDLHRRSNNVLSDTPDLNFSAKDDGLVARLRESFTNDRISSHGFPEQQH